MTSECLTVVFDSTVKYGGMHSCQIDLHPIATISLISIESYSCPDAARMHSVWYENCIVRNWRCLRVNFTDRKCDRGISPEEVTSLIILTIEMDIPGSKTKELLQTLLAITRRMRFEDGCVGCDCLRDVEFGNKHRLIMKWKRRDDLNKHLKSEEFSVLLGAMSLLKQQPEMRLDVVSRTNGIEAIHKARDQHKKNKSQALKHVL